MKGQLFNRRLRLFAAVLILAPALAAQQHVWAGRTLTDFEWAIHDRLASLPMREAFETIDFEVKGTGVVLSGHVLNDRLRKAAEKAAGQVDGVHKVVDAIQVLPSSRRDDALRINVYRAIYKADPPERFNSGGALRIHIIVKDGWVTLEGAVTSDATRHEAFLAAVKVTPHVSDHLRVASDGGRTGI
ncbi:MAG TPA: BON domain-containing protein [Bryobacteraceae bacterium]